MNTISSLVNCKINIGLQIVRKRADGYHDLQTVFYPTDFFTDRLTISPSEKELDFICQSSQDIGPAEDNLCVKAFRQLQRDYGLGGVQILLEKHIPSGAGLGGGSADAAFTLKMLADFFQLPVNKAQLKDYAAQLGSDVPFFIDNVPTYATGRGEIMEPIAVDLSAYEIRIVKPDFSVSTREAYAGVHPHVPPVPVLHSIQQPMPMWKDTVHNDFEDTLFSKYPQLADLKEQFYADGAIYASMSGSGTAVYGIFRR